MVQSEMKAEGKNISMKKLCRWLGVAKSSVYYRPSGGKIGGKSSRPLNQALTEMIRRLIETNLTYGVRRITATIRKELQKAVNRRTVHRIIKANGWQVRQKLRGSKPRTKGMRSQTDSPNERWAIDAASTFCGEDRHIVGWRLSSSGSTGRRRLSQNS